MNEDKLRIWIRDRKVKLRIDELPCSLNELQIILRKVYACGVCEGGPQISKFPVFYTEVARKDKDRWRHKFCDIVLVKKGGCCQKCYRLYRNFLEQQAKHDSQKVKKRDRIYGLTPRAKKTALQLKTKN